MRLERRPEKNPAGKIVQEIWIGTKAQAQSPSYESFTKNEIRTADSTRLDAWHLQKKELNKRKN